MALPIVQGSVHHSRDQSMMCVPQKQTNKQTEVWKHGACSGSGKHTPETKLMLWKAELPLS